MKFREHKGNLTDSMETVVDVADRKALTTLLRSRLEFYGFTFSDEDLMVKPYRFDNRVNWNTHIVTIEDYGVVGFTDGPVL